MKYRRKLTRNFAVPAPTPPVLGAVYDFVRNFDSVPTENAFDPNEQRAADGKWGSGGASPPSSPPADGQDVAGHDTAGQKRPTEQATEAPFTYPKGFHPPRSASMFGTGVGPNLDAPSATRPQLNLAEAKALSQYADVQVYHALNGSLRDGKPLPKVGALGQIFGGKDLAGIHEAMQSVFARTAIADRPMLLKRGVQTSDPHALGQMFANNVGKVVTLPGYQSTSQVSDEHAKGGFKGGVMMTIHAVHGIDMGPYSAYPEEKEILLNHNCEFKVVKAEQQGETWHVELQQLPPKKGVTTNEYLERDGDGRINYRWVTWVGPDDWGRVGREGHHGMEQDATRNRLSGGNGSGVPVRDWLARKFDAALVANFDPNESRDESGRWTAGGGGGRSVADRTVERADDALPAGSGPIKTGNVDVAVRALMAGRKVELEQPRQVSTLLEKLNKLAKAAKAAGKSAPNIDLCNVSVPGTNLFCAQSKGIPRSKMPQLGGIPTPGTPADKLPKNDVGGVDIGPAFIDHLRQSGVTVSREYEDVAYMRASQNQVNGIKVAAIMSKMEKTGPFDRDDSPIFISREGYVIDGHHRWAAEIGMRYRSDVPLKMTAYRVDLPILDVLERANKFAADMGMPQVGVQHMGGKPVTTNSVYRPETGWTVTYAFIPRLLHVLNEFDPNQPRDEAGKWTATGGSSGGKAGDGGSGSDYNPADVPKFHALKRQWAHLNNQLLNDIEDPNGEEARDLSNQMKSLVKQMAKLHADRGSWEDIGLPGGHKDVVIVGAGPGGLASAVMAGTDGLDTLVLEKQEKIGGQAKFSSRIENYPGFPIGTSGQQLSTRMNEQAERLGAEIRTGTAVTGLTHDEKTGIKTLTLSDGSKVTARTVILAGGLEFRKMKFPGSTLDSVTYGDGETLMNIGAGKPVVVIGGSNGAAQAALGAARKADHVYLLSRSPVAKGMSDYQVEALKDHPRVTVMENEEIASYDGDVCVTKSGKRIRCNGVGVFVGSNSDTNWLPKEVALHPESKKIVVDGNLETGVPGVYAIGDIKHGSIGRIGAAVGDGQIAAHSIWDYFGKMKAKEAKATQNHRIVRNRRAPLTRNDYDDFMDEWYDTIDDAFDLDWE